MRRAAALACAVGGAFIVAACSEDIESGAACPALCPNEALATRDTVLEPIVLDTTLSGYPGTGREGVLPLVTRGDTLATRAVLRFDTIPATFTAAGGTETPYTQLETATLVLPIDTARTQVDGPVTVEAYDVDAAGVDTTAAVLLALFRPAGLLGSSSYATRAAVGDTVRVPMDAADVLSRIQSGRRLRIGLVLRSANSAQLNLASSNASASGARLRLRVPGDTSARDVLLSSRTPAAPPGLADDLRDFLLVVRGPAAPPSLQLAAGGVFGRRVLLQFAVPPRILDSSTVVRATLELTQAPNRGAAEAGRPTAIYVQPVTAAQALADTLPGGALRDPGRVASFLCTPTPRASDGAVVCPTTPTASLEVQFRLDSLVRAPRDSGVVRLEIASLIRLWQLPNTPASSRAVVLRAPLATAGGFDSQQGGEVLLFSKRAPAAVRPRLRLTYVTRSSYALP